MFARILTFLVVYYSVSFTADAHAAREWEIKNNYIKDVYTYKDVVSGTGYNVIRITFKDPISTGCAMSDQGNFVTYWRSEDLGRNHASWLSAALAAQAANNKVDVMTDPSKCSGIYGRFWVGIVVHQD